MKTYIIITVTIVILTLTGCKESESLTAFEEMQFSVEKDEVTCTEAWLRVKANTEKKGLQMNLLQDGKQRRKFTMQSKDTVIYVDSLDAGKNYSFRFEMNGEKSSAVDVKTMDTTSHNIEWTTSEFGGVGGSSWMNDVSIVDENDIWAVGEFYPDHSGQPWAVAHWDGTSWKYSKAWYIPYPDVSQRFALPLKTVWAFDKKNVYAGSMGVVLKWNGDTLWNVVAQIGDMSSNWGSITKMWGSSENDIYIAAQKGYIYHYTENGKFVKLKANTELDFVDIWGEYNNENGNYDVYAIASGNNWGTDKYLYKIVDNKLIEIPIPKDDYPIRTLWFKGKNMFILAGSMNYTKSGNGNTNWEIGNTKFPLYAISIRSNDVNDIYFGSGSFNMYHYNGINYKKIYVPSAYGNCDAIAVKGKICCAIGTNYKQARIIILKRN